MDPPEASIHRSYEEAGFEEKPVVVYRPAPLHLTDTPAVEFHIADNLEQCHYFLAYGIGYRYSLFGPLVVYQPKYFSFSHEPIPPANLEESSLTSYTVTEKRVKTAPAAPSRKNEGIFYEAGGGYSSLLTSPFDYAGRMQLAIGAKQDRRELLLYAGLEIAALAEDSSLTESLNRSIYYYDLGIETRFFLLPDSSHLDPYITCGLGIYAMSISFKNSLWDGSTEIAWDIINGINPSIGFGAHLINKERLRLGIVCSPEIYLYTPYTAQGFENDVFGMNSKVSIMGVLSFW